MNQQGQHATKRPALSVLTEPLPLGMEYFIRIAKLIVRHTRKFDLNGAVKYGGHPSVTRSLVEGLKAIGANFNYNPTKKRDLGKDVVVLSGVRTLKQAIKLKQLGAIERIFAGPNIVVRSIDHDSIIASPEIDFVITPSEWVSKAYIEDAPILASKCIEWAAGVDINFWFPKKNDNKDIAILYIKSDLDKKDIHIDAYTKLLNDLGINVEPIIYGHYSQEEFREKLERAMFMVGLADSESQGISWVESWSMDVPTFIQRKDINLICGRKFECSSAPYLSKDTGNFFGNISDLRSLILNKSYIGLEPRNWVLKNMSDSVCANILINRLNLNP